MGTTEEVEKSILDEIKLSLGIPIVEESFNTEILLGLNNAISILEQVGVKISESLTINKNTLWEDVFIDLKNPDSLSMIKQNLYIRIKLVFDPPQYPTTVTYLEKMKEELDIRIRENEDVEKEE